MGNTRHGERPPWGAPTGCMGSASEAAVCSVIIREQVLCLFK